ncbi:hypothetical protein Cgig2_029760 [Carnegiea gigantea]|uniref:Uncharacterized protein n=1 Tax=Carnegiea gigantea TaxID=171969 RepID=A0A9Q1K3M3_9CARY|nr:hypothetical protein Cgig2_029760 [Carnegiea gigantea]
MTQPQYDASVTKTNDSRGNLKLVCGDQFAPDTILEGNSIFSMAANPKWYVIYTGANVQGGPSNYEWLLAWNVPSCGSMEAIPVDDIYKRVETSKSSSTALDAKTKTSTTTMIEAIAHTPALGSAEVYVDCKAIGSMEAIPVDEIYKRAEASKSLSTAVDAKTKTCATIVIEAITDTLAVGCDFKVYN